MEQNQFPEIKTERLLLRRLRETDWEMICYLRTHKEVNKFVKRPGAKSKEEALQFIAKIDSAITNRESFYWSITLIGNEKMIGSISLWHFSKDRKTAEVGYDLGMEFQRKGIMDEALQAVIHFGFGHLKLDLIEAYTHQQNNASKNLLTRNHFHLVKGKKDEGNENNIIYELNKGIS